MSITMFIIAVSSAAAWASLFPQETLEYLAGLKRQLRQRVIQRNGEDAAVHIENKLHAIAKQRGIQPEIVAEVLAEQHTLIVERLGEKYADEILGDADPDRGDP